MKNKKIGALGLRVESHVSKHGLAFNVCNDLKTFTKIIPCGLKEIGVTSLQLEAEVKIDFQTVQKQLTEILISKLKII